jgi:hypothetical protein
MKSKWCKGKAPMHGWCHNRNYSETHCDCPCHPLAARISRLERIASYAKDELSIARYEYFKKIGEPK